MISATDPSASSSDQRLLVLVATYNEATNLPILIDSIFKTIPGASVLIIDDNSPDGTAHVARKLGSQSRDITVITRPRKDGLASALQEGFYFSIRHNFTHLINLDADLSHNPESIPALVSATADSELVIGSRYIDGVRVFNWSPHRLLLSLSAAAFIRTVCRVSIADPTSGFRCFRVSALGELLRCGFLSDGYAVHAELTIRAVTLGFHVKELPICYSGRVYGSSKLRPGMIFEAIFVICRLALSRLFFPKHCLASADGNNQNLPQRPSARRL